MADWLAGPVNGFGYVLKPVNSRPLAPSSRPAPSRSPNNPQPGYTEPDDYALSRCGVDQQARLAAMEYRVAGQHGTGRLVRCPLGHWFNGPIEFLIVRPAAGAGTGPRPLRAHRFTDPVSDSVARPVTIVLNGQAHGPSAYRGAGPGGTRSDRAQRAGASSAGAEVTM